MGEEIKEFKAHFKESMFRVINEMVTDVGFPCVIGVMFFCTWLVSISIGFLIFSGVGFLLYRAFN